MRARCNPCIQGRPHPVLVGTCSAAATALESVWQFLAKLHTWLPCNPAAPLLGVYLRKRNHVQADWYTNGSLGHNGQKLETPHTWMFSNRRMDKQCVVGSWDRLLLSDEKECSSDTRNKLWTSDTLHWTRSLTRIRHNVWFQLCGILEQETWPVVREIRTVLASETVVQDWLGGRGHLAFFWSNKNVLRLGTDVGYTGMYFY